jgi:DNA processing protein
VDPNFELLTLTLLPGVGARTVRDLAARGPLGGVLARPGQHADLLSESAVALLRSGEALRRAEDERALAASLGLRIVALSDEDYPALLRQIYDPPAVLYVRGRLSPDEGETSITIVGSRAATPRGSALARGISKGLASAGATIVSGLARGIDTAAHRGALDAGGRTVAVLGSGLDRIYPQENEPLVSAIAERGAVVSEFPLGTAPVPGNFPRRNRVLAGWGRAVVVVEAARRSGALVTARVALDEGRDVLAVPGHPSDAASVGTNQLIADGAPLVRDAADVALHLGIDIPAAPSVVGRGDDDVFRALEPGNPASLAQLQDRCQRPTSELLARLSELELADRVRRLPGPLFMRP